MQLPENIQKLVKNLKLKKKWDHINSLNIPDIAKLVTIEDMIYEKKIEKAEWDKKWRESNKERDKENKRKWNAENKERKNELDRKWYEANKEGHIELARRRHEIKYPKGEAILKGTRNNQCEVTSASGNDAILEWAHISPRRLLKAYGIKTYRITEFYRINDPLSDHRCINELRHVVLLRQEVHRDYDLVWHRNWRNPRYLQTHETWPIFKSHYQEYMKSPYKFYEEYIKDFPPAGLIEYGASYPYP